MRNADCGVSSIFTKHNQQPETGNQMKTNHFRILVVDDDRPILDLFEKILCPTREIDEPSSLTSSFDLALCKQAREAVDAVRMAIEKERPFAVAFLDIQLSPGPDGVWTAEHIRKMDPDINIVLITGHSDLNLQEIGPRILPTDKLFYMRKPFDIQEIWQCAFSLSSKWKTEKELFTIQAELETIVEKRTSALMEANRKLKAEIEKSGKAEKALRDITDHKRMQQQIQKSLEDLKNTMKGTIRAVAATVEKRDLYTAGHQERVASLSNTIARKMGLSSEQREGLSLAAVVHDIGKITIPAEILSKPGRLNELEFKMIQTHPEVAYEILKPIEFNWPIARIVLQHHERMDGSGYPHGISGEEIMMEARILGVADVVEAMASHRPYRPALGIDKALEEISNRRGTLYDVDVVDACLRVFAEKGFEWDKSG